ncbi:MAG: hypothetical protein SH856_07740 [Flavobacteriales bacterium]|nr:hypothetical protein [Flavobacteriales bacterium]
MRRKISEGRDGYLRHYSKMMPRHLEHCILCVLTFFIGSMRTKNKANHFRTFTRLA